MHDSAAGIAATEKGFDPVVESSGTWSKTSSVWACMVILGVPYQVATTDLHGELDVSSCLRQELPNPMCPHLELEPRDLTSTIYSTYLHD